MEDKFKQLMKTRQGMVGFFVVLFLATVLLSWGLFSFVLKPAGVSTKNVSSTRSKINPNLPKTESCPLNGQKYTTQERDIWNGRRPAVVMIENHAEARPLNGLSKADFVYEAVAEGGITRFAAVFYCGVSAEQVTVAPVRSSRFYFIDWASEYGDRPLYVHVGGANDFGADGGSKPAGQIDPRVDAIGLLEKIGWRTPGGNDLDASYDAGFPEGFSRNPDRLGHEIAYEHTMTLDLDKLFANAESRGLAGTAKNGVPWTKGFVPYSFVDGSPTSSSNASDIKFDFWSSQPDYSVEWKYDSKTNEYKRFNGGQPFTDLNYNNAQITAKNIVVMEVDETGPVDSEAHMIEDNIGTGKAMIFQNGTVIQATWTKKDRTDRTRFTDKNGKEILFVRGVTWVEAVPSGNTVNYN